MKPKNKALPLSKILLLVKIFVILTLIIVLYFFFFVDVYNKWLSQLTNVSQREEKYSDSKEKAAQPTMTACIELKPSVLKANNLPSNFPLKRNESQNLLPLETLYMEAGYKLGRDLFIYLYDPKLGQHLDLKLGDQTLANGLQLSINEIPTLKSGLCYSITPNATDNFYNYRLTFSVNVTDEDEEGPDQVNMYLTAQHEESLVIFQDWAFVVPVSVNDDFGQGSIVYSIKEHQINVIDCNDTFESIHQCFIEKVNALKLCEPRCNSFLWRGFSRYLPNDLPECQTAEEEFCLYESIKNNITQFYGECLPRCQRVEFVRLGEQKYQLGVVTHGSMISNNQMAIMIESMATRRIVSQEYYVYDGVGLIGTVGGFLGLFLGFSFLTCYDFIVNLILMFKSHIRHF